MMGQKEPRFTKPTGIQSLIFDKKKFTVKQAKKWAKDRNFQFGKVDEKPDTIRLRQFDPKKCQKGTFRTIDITNGVKAVICVKK